MLSLIQSWKGVDGHVSNRSIVSGITTSRTLLLSTLFLFVFSGLLAEGTPELAPNMSTTFDGKVSSSAAIGPQTSNDVAALNIGNFQYNYFAYRGKSEKEANLNVYLKDPNSESLYIGLSSATDNRSYGRAFVNYRFYVVDPNGTVVYTSPVIDQNSAPITQDANSQNALDNGWVQAMGGATQLGGTGYDAIEITSAELTSGGFTTVNAPIEASYTIEFEALDANGDPISGFGETEMFDQYLLINYWDINVGENGAGKTGRVWSQNWGLFAINDFGFPFRPFNGEFFVCAPDPSNTDLSYITKIDFDNAGYIPGGFNVAFNSFGTSMEDPSSGLFFPATAKSVPGENATDPEYNIFLNDPVEICLAADAASMLNLNGITNCETNAVNYCISFGTDKPGDVVLTLDFDGPDGKYTPGTTDRQIPFTVNQNNVGNDICINWDGLDGLGNAITGEVPLFLEFIQGRYNFPIYDAEYMTNGFMIEAVRPAGPAPRIFYDDTDIPEDSGTGSPKDGTAGCDAPCHNWSTYIDGDTPGYGNRHTINTWWFSNRLVDELIAEFPVVLDCTLEGPSGICPNSEETITLSLTATPDNGNTPDYEVEWTGPGITSSTNESVTVNAGGEYIANVSWTTSTGEMCSTTCSHIISDLEEAYLKIDTLIAGQDYTYEGQTFTADTTARFVYENAGANGCDSILDLCLVFRPDVELFCDITGPAGICEGGFDILTLSTSYEPTSEPEPTINSITWSGSGIIDESDPFAIVVTGGATYTAVIEYTDQNGNVKSTTCEIVVDQYPNIQVKDSITVPYGDVVTIDGVDYASDTMFVVESTTTFGCDSIVTYCIDVEDPEYEVTCELNGPAGICLSETGQINLTWSYSPSTAPAPNVVIDWSGGGIIDSNDDFATVTGGDSYRSRITYTNPFTGEVKETTCEIFVDQYPEYLIEVDTVKLPGETIVVFGVNYDSEGEFIEEYQTGQGCDSTVIVRIVEEKALLCYDLDDCKSVDYDRFVPKVAEDFDCGLVSGSPLYRVNPHVNAHSCTEGVLGNAICISSVDECEYPAGDQRSAIIDVVIQPDDNKAVKITALNFFERAPEMYQWNIGREGVNNPPQLFGVRILVNGVEVFSESGLDTHEDWTSQNFRLSSVDGLTIETPSLVRFELVGYCTAGVDSHVNAWDLDEIKIYASCSVNTGNRVEIAGAITTSFGDPLENVEVMLESDNPELQTNLALTNSQGKYAFTDLTEDYDYSIVPELDRNHLEGVTTADILLIQRHILGLETFENPYQFIAADANNSGDISAIDILVLRKLILGIYDEFPNNTSYRFNRADQELTIDNPWVLGEEYMMDNMTVSFPKAHFNGIKVGDVSSFREVNGSTQTTGRLYNSSSLRVNNEKLQSGSAVQLTVDLNNENMNAAQFALKFDNASNVSVDGLVEGESYFYNRTENTLRVIWTNDKATEFTVNFTPEVSDYADQFISLDQSEFPAIAFLGDNLSEEGLALTFNKTAADELTTMSVTPNPFEDNLRIELPSSTTDQATTVEVLDLSGRRLFKTTLTDNNSTFTISKSDIANFKGVLIIKAFDGLTTQTQRVISL